VRPSFEQQVASVPAYFRALNRLALTGIVDEGISSRRDDYRPIFEVWRKGGFTLRVRYDVMGLKPGGELAEFQDLLKMIPPRWGDDWLRLLGLGEIVINDMYDGSVVAKDVPPPREAQHALFETAMWAARNSYPIHIHASHNGTAAKILDVFETVNKTVPIAPLRWEISHIEDASDDTLRRMAAIGVAFAVQNRMYFGGNAYAADHDPAVTRRSPPIKTAMHLGVIVSGGTDANVPAPYNPFIALRWLLDGRTLTGMLTRSQDELLSREEALRLFTLNGAWLSFEEHERGSLEPEKLADLAVLDRDYMTVPVEEVAKLHSMLTLVGGKAVYAEGPFAPLEATARK
jgi:predicted amidohydrolase YtcJ